MRLDTSLSCVGLPAAWSVRSAGGPSSGPGPLTKLVAEGDSITFAAGSYAELWADANPGVAFANHAESGNGIDDLSARLAAMMAAEDPSHLTVLIGTNDMMSAASAAAYAASVFAYVAAAKALKPALAVGVCGLPPVDETAWGQPGFNARRAEYNALLRAAVPSTGSGQIDFYVPLGDHPLMLDAAALDAGLFGDGVHPTASGYAIIAPVYAAVMDGILAEDTGAVPDAFVLADTGAVPSTDYFADTGPIAGLGMGVAAIASISGDGEFARGHGSFGTSPIAVMNGDVCTVKVTSSSEPDTQTAATLSIGGSSDTLTVHTGGESALTTTYRSHQAANNGWGANYTFAEVAFHAGKNIVGIATLSSGVPGAVTLGGTSAAKVAEISSGGLPANTISFWEVDKASDGTGDLLVTQGAINSIGYVLWSTDANAEFAEAQSLGYDYHADPSRTPSITMPAGGSILVMAQTENGGNSIAPEEGTTEVAEFADSVPDPDRKFWAGSLAATGQAGLTGLNYAGSQMLAIALAP